jgi:glycosyltransferase involved in cell wall biosynthesis
MPDKSTALLSIIIPCFNQAIYLHDCLDSILQQSFSDWEAIVVNDGSSDDTNNVAKAYCQKDSRIKLIEKQNGGLSSARNYGIQNSTGDWLLFLDADDMLMNHHFQETVQVISSKPDVNLIQTGYHHMNEDGKQILHTVVPNNNRDLLPTILIQNIGPVHTLIVRRSIILKMQGFDETLNSCEDWDMWIRVGKSGIKKESINKALVGYRLATNSMSRNAERMYMALKDVANRAIKKDFRLSDQISGNVDYKTDPLPGIKSSLLKCLGLSIMQGKVDDALRLFNEETAKYNFTFEPKDFSLMNSYLSFRYLTSKEDIEFLFKNIYPHFQNFFNRISYSENIQQACLRAVFYKHRMIRNKHKWGVWSPLINRLSNFFRH